MANKHRKRRNTQTSPVASSRPAGASRRRTRSTVSEPSPEAIAAEQTRVDENLQALRNAQRRGPAPGQDLLASYMDGLSHIPLFTPEQEIDNARHLETLEVQTWRLILELPRGAELAGLEAGEADESVVANLKKLRKAYERDHKQRRKMPSRGAARVKLVEACAGGLRRADHDKELLDAVMCRFQRDVWNRSESRPLYRIDADHLSGINSSRDTAMRARNNFVRANLRLVVSVARNFHHSRVPFIDLIQEGNVGLLKAVHRFDYNRGFRFSTYAHWWIRQSIERAIINKGSQVRLPVHVIDSRRQLHRAINQLTQDLGRAPHDEELARRLCLTEEKIEEIRAGVQQNPVSLDETVNDSDARRFVDMLCDDTQPGVDEKVIKENTFDRVKDLLQKLNPIEKDIIRRRFGLENDSDQTLDEIGKLYNLSRERVRQIQAQSLNKMRRMCDRREIGLV